MYSLPPKHTLALELVDYILISCICFGLEQHYNKCVVQEEQNTKGGKFLLAATTSPGLYKISLNDKAS